MLTERWSFAQADSFGLTEWSLLPRASVFFDLFELFNRDSANHKKKETWRRSKTVYRGIGKLIVAECCLLTLVVISGGVGKREAVKEHTVSTEQLRTVRAEVTCIEVVGIACFTAEPHIRRPISGLSECVCTCAYHFICALSLYPLMSTLH
jgi:hypothetical protein